MLRFLSHISILSSVFLSSGLGAQAQRHYNIVNNCPTSINLYINGVAEGSLTTGASTSRNFSSSWDGFIYTTSNGAELDGSRTTRAGFYGESSYYYIVVDPNYLNTGISITPINHSPNGGFCVTAQCSSITCSTAYQQPPTAFPSPVGGVAPNPPLYECPDQLSGYTVSFCPSGNFPPSDPPRTLHPGADLNKCLDVREAKFADGTPVQIYDCNGTGAQMWVISRGSTKVRVHGTNYCLDAGSTPGNGVGMKIWQCYDNLPAQQWYYTQDDRIAFQDHGLCLDLTNGILANSNRVQTWKCTDGNNNQIWYW